ncbi:uncharacterized protein BO72DRAFT_485934 [Aspergillus fijiensis CBS 313.89]|uniref:Polyamine transporter n=1 Tax=Aspergillus fijiensis CBS 313.89 TaxID=1448319 RepID=A0A8G1VZD6_9EURO|nr:uncharacterized protein BO72DRAFT_485934 [Aspergillus fijiensis CBS 313.89]RAK77403.1 hypothetical protein BO72DRAFT_485934 [Aspergillus fijiensis CBS 313.89]
MAGFAGTALDLANQLAQKEETQNWDKAVIEVTYTLSASIAGIAYGPLLINPLAHAFGRTAIIFWCLFFAMACAIWSANMTGRGDYERFVASRLLSQRRIAWLPFRIGLSPIGLMIGLFQFASFGWFVATHSLITVWLEKPVTVGGWGFTAQRNAFFIFSLWAGLLTAELWGYLCNDRIALWVCCTRNKGVWKPECRLHTLWIPSLILLPIGLGIIGAALQYHLHYMVLALGAYLITFASMSSVPVAVTYAIECVAAQPTEVAAFMGAYRLSLGLVIPFFIDQWVARVGFGWVYGMMAFFSIFAFTFVVGLMGFGERLRERTLRGLAAREIGRKIVDDLD